MQPAPQQQLAEPMAAPLQVLARVVARPGQIAHGLGTLDAVHLASARVIQGTIALAIRSNRR